MHVVRSRSMRDCWLTEDIFYASRQVYPFLSEFLGLLAKEDFDRLPRVSVALTR